MSDITFRQPTVQTETREYQDGYKENVVGADGGNDGYVEGDSMSQTVLDVLGVEERYSDLPSEELSNLKEITSYIEDSLVKNGKRPSVKSIGNKLDEIREDLGLDDDSDVSIVLDRVGGVVKAWRNLGFMSPEQKRSMFMKLARCKDSKEMHKIVYAEMQRSDIW